MPEISITKGHILGAEEAKNRIDTLLASISFSGEVSNPTWNWTGYSASVSFTMYGATFKGEIAVTPNTVSVSGQVPLVAWPFRSRIENGVSDRIEKALE